LKKPSRKGLKNKLDRIVSEIVRARGYCVWCGNPKYELLQCCHIYSRSNLAVRWDLNNLLCMCAGCHFKAHQRPLEFASFVKEFLGKFKYTELKNRANSIKKWYPHELIDLYQRFLEIKEGV